MFYLYLKIHNDTGLKYLGYTKKDPFVYQGSGKHWKLHITKHGYDVITVVLYETPFIEEIKELGLYFSDLWNIVDSMKFANMVVECGGGGPTMAGRKHKDETKQKMSNSHKKENIKEILTTVMVYQKQKNINNN